MSAPAEPVVVRIASVQWAVIFAGAIAAAGVSFTLHAFAAGVGLSLVSAAPGWREASVGLWLVSGLYLLFVAVLAFLIGGYIAGRMRAPLGGAMTGETEFRDGMHGLVVWGLAIVMTAALALGTAAHANRNAAPVGEAVLVGQLDQLFRSDELSSDIDYRRAEAGRILLKTSGHEGLSRDDRDYLETIVMAGTGLGAGTASARVNLVVVQAAEELRHARIAAVLQAFFVGAALFVGAAVAWFAACQGGRDRETGRFPIWGRVSLR